MTSDNNSVPQEQSPDVRRFHIGDILSVAPGYLVSLRHFDGVFDILNFMVRESVFLHQAPRVRLECEPYLYQQFPWLKEAGEQLGREIENYPRDKRIANNVQCASWLMPLIAKYGEYHDVRRIPMDDHDVIDPIDEAVKKVGKDRVIPFSLDDDEPGVGGGYEYENNPAPEEWRDVPGYEGRYRVSDMGRVMALRKPRALKSPPFLTPRLVYGYPRVALTRNRTRKDFYIYELVMFAFVGPRPKGYHIDHINAVRADSRLVNLRYITAAENCAQGGDRNRNYGERSGQSKLTELQVREIRRLYSEGTHNKAEIGRMYGVARRTISDIVNGITWPHLIDTAPQGAGGGYSYAPNPNPAPQPAPDGIAAALRYEPLDVETELVYMRSRRIITARDCYQAETLFQCQIAAARTDQERAEISAQWMAQLWALKAVS